MTNEVTLIIKKIAKCEEIHIPKNITIANQLHHLMIRCEMKCSKYFSCKLISQANDILVDLEGI